MLEILIVIAVIWAIDVGVKTFLVWKVKQIDDEVAEMLKED